MRSTKRPSSISLHDAQVPQGVAVTPVSQLRHFERMRAMVVLPTPRVPGEQECVMHAALRQRVAQRHAHVLLPDQFGEGTRPPFARKREITHENLNPWEAARTSRTSAPDIAATAAPFRA